MATTFMTTSIPFPSQSSPDPRCFATITSFVFELGVLPIWLSKHMTRTHILEARNDADGSLVPLGFLGGDFLRWLPRLRIAYDCVFFFLRRLQQTDCVRKGWAAASEPGAMSLLGS